jgi:hypothetical protein
LLDRQRLAESGQTERAKIFADADVATAGQRSAAQLAAIAAQDAASRRNANAQNTSSILGALTRALGQLAGGRSQSGQGSGQGNNPYGTPPFNPNRTRYSGAPTPNIGPILFDPGYVPSYPDIPDFFGSFDNFFNPFSDVYDPFSGGSSDIYSSDPTITFGSEYGFGEDYFLSNPFGGGYYPSDNYGDYGGSYEEYYA